LPYNEAFLREVMRRETVIPMAVAHRATEDTELSGYNIPKVSSCVFFNLGQAHMKIKGALVNRDYLDAGHCDAREPVELP
jgi:hypothetical protein